jgi:hypothetical protein
MKADGRLERLIANRYVPEVVPPRPCAECERLYKPLRRGLCARCWDHVYRPHRFKKAAARPRERRKNGEQKAAGAADRDLDLDRNLRRGLGMGLRRPWLTAAFAVCGLASGLFVVLGSAHHHWTHLAFGATVCAVSLLGVIASNRETE